MKPAAYMTTDKRMLVFADVEEWEGMTPLYDGRDIDQIIKAIKKCFPHTMACDGTLMVTTQSYNELVELINK